VRRERGAGAGILRADGDISLPYTPSTGGDILALVLAPGCPSAGNTLVVVENRPGGDRPTSAPRRSRRRADRRTTLCSPRRSFTNIPALTRALPLAKPGKAAPRRGGPPRFATSAMAVRSSPGARAHGGTKLVDSRARQPGKLYYGSRQRRVSAPGEGACLKLTQESDVVHVPYKGSAARIARSHAARCSHHFGD